MRKSRIHGSAAAIGLAAFTFFGASTVAAHHSFAAVFDASRPVKLSGTITRVEWANPHIWFYVNVAEEDGRLSEWGFSGAPPGVLMRRGITKDVLQIGAVVNVEGFLARDGSRNASGGRVTFPDGRNVFTASNEDAVPDRSE